MKPTLLPILAIVLFLACQPAEKQVADTPAEPVPREINPPAQGFNLEGSDAKAMAIADDVMDAMGGRKAWDDAGTFAWNFFGARKLVWDKQSGDVRIDSQRDDLKIIMNLQSKEGRVFKNGEEFSDQDSVDFYLDRGERIWINDSYWLVMPFKLKDSGVTLSYLGEDTTQTGASADVLRLTFENVGVTPDNVYDVWVEKEPRLLTQWAYYREAGQEEPNFITPWTEYQSYNGLLLSGERGDRDLTEIQLMKNAPAGAFDDFSWSW